MQDEKMKMVEGLKKLKDAIENFVDNMELDKAEEEMNKPKKKKEEKEEPEEK
jgi:hypothetical protein